MSQQDAAGHRTHDGLDVLVLETFCQFLAEFFVYSGCWRTLNFSTYSGLCRPDVKRKWPSRTALVSTNNCLTSASVIMIDYTP